MQRSADVSTRRLIVFKAVVETGGFAAAAESLGITQPSISNHIKALEDQFQQQIILRGPGRGLHLTEAGKALFAHACNVARSMNTLTADLEHIETRLATRLTVGTQRGWVSERICSFVSSFVKNRGSNVQIALKTGPIEGIFEALRTSSVDLGIYYAIGPAPELKSFSIGSDRLVLYAAHSHALAQKRRLAAKDFAKVDFVGPISDSYFSRIYDTVMNRMGIRKYRAAIEVQESRMMIEIVRSGVGIGCGLASQIADHVARGELVRLSMAREEEVLVEIYCSYATGNGVSQVAIEFTRFLQRYRAFGPILPP